MGMFTPADPNLATTHWHPPTTDEARGQVVRLVDAFRGAGRDQSEADVRQSYIDPLLRALGWPVGEQPGVPARLKDVEVEPPLASPGQTNKRPDYLLRIGGYTRFVIEAKKPSVDLAGDREAIFQAKSYAWSLQVPFAVLTDFEEWRVFDATIKPRIDEPKRGLVADFDLRYEDYATRFGALYEMFGRAAVAGGSLEELLRQVKRIPRNRRVRGVDRMLLDIRGSTPVDRDFLDFLQDYRLRFARALYADNKAAFPDAHTDAGAAKLSEAAQRLLDRLVFLRVCEDRNIANYGEIRDLLDDASESGEDPYARLVAHFRRLAVTYNGYLFREHFTEGLEVDGHLLSDFIRDLYPPESPYRFAAIRDDLLGVIYERFLGHTITVDKKGNVRAEEKPEVRHAGGVYYTPQFVVDAIVRRTVGELIKGKAPGEIVEPKKGIKVVDPACGSGSFLIAALDYLMEHCRAHVAAHPEDAVIGGTSTTGKRRTIAFQDAEDGEWHLTPEFRGELLTACIYGVDIDQQAVEVSVMSLYLKMLEDRLPPRRQEELYPAKLLPPLEANVACGNALLSQSDFDSWWLAERGNLFEGDAELRFRLNRFDWSSRTRGFGDVMAHRGEGLNGFDAVIGNPPYIRVQELKKWAPEESEFYKWRYESASRGSYDIYVCFIERGLNLLNDRGLLGYICPHKFWSTTYGDAIRNLIGNTYGVRSIISFADQQVFQGATTYTAIHILGASPNGDSVDFALVHDLNDATSQVEAIDSGRIPSGAVRFEAAPPTTARWVFSPKDLEEWANAFAEGKPTLAGIADEIFVGLQTSDDPVFLFDVAPPKASTASLASKALQEDVQIESELLRPVVRSGHIGRHWAEATASILFPYQLSGNRAAIIPPRVMKDKFPATWEYLRRCEVRLRARQQGKFDHDEWYGLMRKNLEKWEAGSKLMVPYMVSQLGALHASQSLYFVNVTTGGFGVRSSRASLDYLQALLCSKPMDIWFKRQAGRFHSGYFGANKQYIEALPIKLPDDTGERKLAEEMSKRARRIVDAKAALRKPAVSDRERRDLEASAEGDERAIDELVCRLYGIDPGDLPDPTD